MGALRARSLILQRVNNYGRRRDPGNPFSDYSCKTVRLAYRHQWNPCLPRNAGAALIHLPCYELSHLFVFDAKRRALTIRKSPGQGNDIGERQQEFGKWQPPTIEE